MAKELKQGRKDKVIDVLNKARAMELQAIHQYMNQHYNIDNMDYGDLAAKIKLIAIDEMRHAEMFAERIEDLGGQPTTALAAQVTKGQQVLAQHLLPELLHQEYSLPLVRQVSPGQTPLMKRLQNSQL